MVIILIIIFFQTSSGAPNNAPANKSIANNTPDELLLAISNSNEAIPRSGYGLINVDNEQNRYFDNSLYDFRKGVDDNDQGLSQNANFKNDYNDDSTKRRRKRRKPKQFDSGLRHPAYQYGGFGPNINPYLQEQHSAPSLGSSLLSSVSNALLSIAKYDDRQCVARLLCEAASGALPTSLFDRVSGLQPLLTLLTAYSGLQSSPLLVFGRAVLVGASSAACRSSHPLCPTDTEELVHYLNNHNGGFFRFFNSPQRDQNIDQFYNQIQQHHFNEHYGFHNGPVGLYQSYPHHGQYGFAFPYDNNDEYMNTIQKRIQNKAPEEYGSFEPSKWTFPGVQNSYNEDPITNNDFNYLRNELKFPNDQLGNYRKTRGFTFPSNNNLYITEDDERLIFNKYNPSYTRSPVTTNDNNNYKPSYNGISHSNHRDIKGFQTVYVVRGDGDPNRPEIIHLGPGETVQ